MFNQLPTSSQEECPCHNIVTHTHIVANEEDLTTIRDN